MCLKGWVKTETCRFNGWLWSEERCYEVRGEDTRLNRIACFWGENREEASAIVERGTRVQFGCFEKYYFRKYLTYPVVKISGAFFFFFFLVYQWVDTCPSLHFLFPFSFSPNKYVCILCTFSLLFILLYFHFPSIPFLLGLPFPPFFFSFF